MNEILITQRGALSYDFESAKEYLTNKLEAYKGIIFTEDTKKDAKSTVAELRKEQKAFSTKVKEIKAEYMKPYEEFYEKACELIDMYEEPIGFINEQIEAFEEQRIQKKKKEIQDIYTELVPEEIMIDMIPLQKIYNHKWENATFTGKQIREEIMERKIKAKEALETIKSMESEKEEQAIEMYKRDFDLSACVVYLNNYEKQKREIMAREEERLKAEAEERIRAEERARIEAEIKQAEAIEQAKVEAVEMLIPDDSGEEVKDYSYTISMTPEAKEKLEMYMNSVGIEFEELTF